MKEKRVNFIGNFFPGVGLGIVISYENKYIYVMGAIPFYQFYLDIKIIKMTDQEITKYGEIQYLKGRLDELHKALPTITNLERKRKLDQRIEKYFLKLKKLMKFHIIYIVLSY